MKPSSGRQSLVWELIPYRWSPLPFLWELSRFKFSYANCVDDQGFVSPVLVKTRKRKLSLATQHRLREQDRGLLLKSNAAL